jgi:aspartate/methionine/tyrosine aminotransferase
MRLSKNARATPASGIREIVHRAMKHDGAIRLEVGEGTLLTPPHIIRAALADAERGFTRYTASAGCSDLRTAICDKLARINRVEASEENVIITAGGIHGLFLAFATLCDPGEEVLVPNPGWPNYEMICRLLGLRCKAYPCYADSGFRPDVEEVESKISARTRVLVVNSPNNPSGAVYPQSVIEEFVAIAARNSLMLIGDEAYDELYYGDPPVAASSIRSIEDGGVASVFSFSKTYAMTGWRVGYVVGPLELIRMMTKLQEPTISCVSSISQRAALVALREGQNFVQEQRRMLVARRNAVVRLLDERGEFVYQAEGGIYLLLRIAPLQSRQFSLDLLEHEGIAVAPGRAFGSRGDGFVRICYAAGGDDLEPALQRLLDRKEKYMTNDDLSASGAGPDRADSADQAEVATR